MGLSSAASEFDERIAARCGKTDGVAEVVVEALVAVAVAAQKTVIKTQTGEAKT
jgi:hypothetical protein